MASKKYEQTKFLFVWLFLFLALSGVLAGCAEKGIDDDKTADSSLRLVKERGKLIVGTFATYQPMEFKDDSGMIVGFDIDVANEIASGLGVSLEVVDYGWEELFSAVKSGEADIAVASMTITVERAETLLFSVPYFNGGQVIIARQGNTNISSPEDLGRVQVGAQKGTTCELAARQYTEEPLLVLFDDSDMEIDALREGIIEAVVMDYVAGTEYVKNDPSIMIIGEPFTQEYYGIPTKLGNDALMDEINRILRYMKRTGRLDEIKAKWVK